MVENGKDTSLENRALELFSLCHGAVCTGIKCQQGYVPKRYDGRVTIDKCRATGGYIHIRSRFQHLLRDLLLYASTLKVRIDLVRVARAWDARAHRQTQAAGQYGEHGSC